MNELRVRRAGPATALVAPLLLLAVLAETAGLGDAGWSIGLASAVTIAAALTRGLARSRQHLGAASWVTLARATLAVGVAALAADSFTRDTPVALLVTLAAVALALDLVDGWLARRTTTATALGARFDGEVDAFLILALSVYAAPAYGAWVLLIGAARYLFGVGQWRRPWMRAALPPRRWRKAVAAVQGIVLTIAAADVLPRALTQALLLCALALLAASMGECAWWLWRRRDEAPAPPPRGPLRRGLAVAVTVLAVALVWAAFAAPDQPSHLNLGGFLRLPLELLAIIAVGILLRPMPRRVLAVVVGGMLGVILVVKALDLGFYTVFDRPFNPYDDWSHRHAALETLRDAFGRSHVQLALTIVVVVLATFVVLLIAALLRVTRVAAGHRNRALRVVVALGAIGGVLGVLGAPVVSTNDVALAVREVQAVQVGLHDRVRLAREIAHDRFRATPGDRLLTGLRGKDVLLLFVESYGKIAVQGASFSPQVDALLDKGNAQLRAAGFASRSAFLTSPTFGGISWLAHSTMQSGVWIDSQRRYDQLVRSDRFTLSQAFKRAGWRAIDDIPSDNRTWTVGSTFYHYDKVHDSRDVGYRGPRFGYPTMPDQYTMLALQRLELARRHRPPLFAEVDLLSSHIPWTRIPRLIPWNEVGDGSVFYRVPVEASSQTALFHHPDAVRAAYGHSIEYTLSTIFSFVQHYGRKNLVLVVLGDHQPSTRITGLGASHDVPVSVIAHDPKVLERIAGWGWQDGLLPSPQAPVWRMNAFRDRFLSAFSSRP